jgi:hypothetical protein
MILKTSFSFCRDYCSVQFKNEGWRTVADVVRQLNAVGLAAVSADFGILTNSATRKFNLDKALGRKVIGSTCCLATSLGVTTQVGNYLSDEG